MAAAAQPKRTASGGGFPSASATAKAPEKASPAPSYPPLAHAEGRHMQRLAAVVEERAILAKRDDGGAGALRQQRFGRQLRLGGRCRQLSPVSSAASLSFGGHDVAEREDIGRGGAAGAGLRMVVTRRRAPSPAPPLRLESAVRAESGRSGRPGSRVARPRCPRAECARGARLDDDRVVARLR